MIPALPALAQEVPFQEVERTEQCRFLVGPQDEHGLPHLRAECDWPDRNTAQLDAVLGDWSSYSRCFSTIASASVLERQGEVARVHHIHAVPAASDREVVLEMRRAPVEGGWRYAWTRSPQQVDPTEGRVLVVRDDGFWEVIEAPGGGVHVATELQYNPGGALPTFAVRWFQTAGMVGFVEQLRACTGNL